MRVVTPLARLLPSSSHAATTHGHTLGAPRRYEAVANLLFLGRRRATFRALMAAAGLQPGQRVLDVGCGTGYFVRLLAQTVGPAGLVVGIDPSPEMITYASRKADRIRQCQFQVGTAEALAFANESFDLVVSSLMMHHLPEDLQLPALREMRRVLRPGGTLLVADAQLPRQGLGWRLLALLTDLGHMAQKVPPLQLLAAQAEFAEIRTGQAPPWLRFVRAVKPTSAGAEAQAPNSRL